MEYNSNHPNMSMYNDRQNQHHNQNQCQDRHHHQSAPASIPSTLGSVPRKGLSQDRMLNQNQNQLEPFPITQPDAVTPPISPLTYASAQPQQQQPQPHKNANANASANQGENLEQFVKSPNGAGMWKAWTNSFKTPLLALLDMFDNSIDASLNVFEHGRRRRPMISAQIDDYEQSGLVLRNSCVQKIPTLRSVLTVYNSCKSSNSDSIGENGVGVKQAAASLSDLTFLITRNGDVLELGFLMASLQQENMSVVAPDYTFVVGVDLEDQLQQLAQDHPTVYGEAFRVYGDGDVALGMDHLLRHFQELTTGQNWKPYNHVFCVLIPRLRHGAGSQTIGEAELLDLTENDGDSYKVRTTRMLTDLAEKLPSTYIHCQELDVWIQKKKIDFHYWEKRLVELTEFTIQVDPKEIWHSSLHWRRGTDKYPEAEGTDTMRVFCGFDPQRVSGKKSAAASLYVHSRASGRLIKHVGDTRGDLGLVSGSTDMSQGLTILLDDYEGSLPLNTTKQDIAFGNETYGQVKSDNLYAWVAGVVHFYWNMQMDLFEKKSAISTAVADCAEALLDDEHVNHHNGRPFGNGNFTRYEDVVWRNVNGNIRCEKGNRRKARKVQGMDTLVSLKVPATPPNEKKPARKKRKANAMMIEIDDLKQEVLEGVASCTQLRQIKDRQKQQIEKLTAKAEEQAEQIEELTAQGEEHTAAELEWKSKKQELKRAIREKSNRLSALESETQPIKAESPNHHRDQVKTLRRQLQMAQDDGKMKEDLSQQAENQIQTLENLISDLKAQNEMLRGHNQTLRRRSSNVYVDIMDEEDV